MRFLAAVCIVFLFGSVTTTLVFGAHKGHGCAPLTPPPVAGTLFQPSALHGLLFINEALLTPHSTWNCTEVNTYSPIDDTWVEIYNSQNRPYDLYAVHTSLDSGPNTYPFYFPYGSAIAAHGFLVVFPRLSPTFLSTETARLRLTIAGTAVDEATIPSLAEDQSYARFPDGSVSWQISSQPTIDASNTVTASTPTRTRTYTPTSTTVHRPRGGGGSTGSGSSGGNTASGSDQPPSESGTQTAWGGLQFPTPSPTAPEVTPSVRTSTPVSQTSNTMDIPRKILMTLGAVTLAAGLLWLWRRFSVP